MWEDPVSPQLLPNKHTNDFLLYSQGTLTGTFFFFFGALPEGSLTTTLEFVHLSFPVRTLSWCGRPAEWIQDPLSQSEQLSASGVWIFWTALYPGPVIFMLWIVYGWRPSVSLQDNLARCENGCPFHSLLLLHVTGFTVISSGPFGSYVDYKSVGKDHD